MPSRSQTPSTSPDGAIGQVEAVLDGHDLDDDAGLGELLHADVREADMTDLALVLELPQRADGLGVGHARSGACSW